MALVQIPTPVADSGSMTELASGTLSGASVTLSSISQNYRDLYLVINGYRVSDNASTPFVGVNGNASGDIYGAAFHPNGNTQSFNYIQPCATRTVRTGSFDNNAYVYFYNYTTSTRKAMQAGGTYYDGSAENYYFGGWIGGNRSAGAVTSINILLNSTYTYTAGTYILYGVK